MAARPPTSARPAWWRTWFQWWTGGVPPEVLSLPEAERQAVLRQAGFMPTGQPLSAGQLAVLAGHENASVRSAVARHPACPVEVLRQFAHDKDDWVRTSVARHPNCPADLLVALSTDQEVPVRLAAAQHPRTPEQVLVAFLSDPDQTVRHSAAERAPLSTEQRAALLAQRSNWLALLSNPAVTVGEWEALALRLNTPARPPARTRLLDSRDWWLTRLLARSRPLSAATLSALANHENRVIRRAVAENTACPPDILEGLAADRDPRVRAAVAGHLELPAHLLPRLARDGFGLVRLTLVREAELPEDLCELLATDRLPDVRWWVVAQPDLSLHALRSLAADEDRRVRELASGVLGRLLNHPDAP